MQRNRKKPNIKNEKVKILDEINSDNEDDFVLGFK